MRELLDLFGLGISYSSSIISPLKRLGLGRRGNHDCVFSHLSPQGARVAQLATQSRMAPQTIVWHVDQLERLGYVERIPDPSDRRAKLIRPTEHGLAFMAAARDALADIEHNWTSALGPDSLTQLRDALRAIRSLERDTNTAGRAPS